MFLQLYITILDSFAWEVSNISKSSDRPGLAWKFMMKWTWQVFHSWVFVNVLSASNLCSKQNILECTLAKALLLTSGLFLPLGGWGEWSNVCFPYVVNYFDADFQHLLLSENWSRSAAQTDQSIQNPFGVVCTMGFIYNRMKECVRGGLIWEKPEVLPIRSPANPMEHPWSHLVYLSCVEGHVLELRATKYDEIWLCESSLSYWAIESNINIWVWYICLLLQHYHFAFTLVNGIGYLSAHKLICKSDFNSMNFEEFWNLEDTINNVVAVNLVYLRKWLSHISKHAVRSLKYHPSPLVPG